MRPTELFQFTTDTDPLRLGAPVLHVALEGFMDAGAVGAQVAAQIGDVGDVETIVRFDTDLLHDYRARRPRMVFERDHWAGYDPPTLELQRGTDAEGTPFLLLVGAEPDLAWDRFVEAVVLLCRTLGVRRMVTTHGIPMAVPHTRPVSMTRYASDPALIPADQAGFGVVEVPGSVESLLHLRLPEQGVQTIGIGVHVPHYIADSEYTDAAVAAMRELGGYTDLVLPFDALVEAVEANRARIDAGVEASPEAGEVIRRLEQQYDRVLEGRRRRGMLAADVADLPSAEEIGAEFEEFLREGESGSASPGATDDDTPTG